MLHESAHKNTYLTEKKPKEYLCGDSAMKPPHNSSPWFPSFLGGAGAGVPVADIRHQFACCFFYNLHLFLSNSVCFPSLDYSGM